MTCWTTQRDFWRGKCVSGEGVHQSPRATHPLVADHINTPRLNINSLVGSVWQLLKSKDGFLILNGFLLAVSSRLPLDAYMINFPPYVMVVNCHGLLSVGGFLKTVAPAVGTLAGAVTPLACPSMEVCHNNNNNICGRQLKKAADRGPKPWRWFIHNPSVFVQSPWVHTENTVPAVS